MVLTALLQMIAVNVNHLGTAQLGRTPVRAPSPPSAVGMMREARAAESDQRDGTFS
jgi:hypothetical protein